jgi:hypothetical protein
MIQRCLVAVIFLAIFPGSAAFSTSSDQIFETLPMDGTIQIEGTPAIGDIFTITFKFTLTGKPFNDRLYENIYKINGPRAEKGDSRSIKLLNKIKSKMDSSIDRADLKADTNIEYLSPTTWTGKLETGKEIIFRAKARPRHVLETRIVGVVRTSCMSKTGRGMTANFFTSPAIFEGAVPKPTPPTWHTLPNANDSSVIIRSVVNTAPPLGNPRRPIIVDTTGSPMIQ